ncbi:site-2 protease family protein [Alkalicaulis satelles]|uniref:Site-2 protease family protein n=1 Tax=Alkalicaulis satelles TaxID=2609175 RepID=A0A5M6ZER2_9PROT|nr:M50 family metallopeptidase [Alkalicaulis satelles]KAA5801588.1 site-2 protease family protein [Alkalicaulis satelles]
MTELFGAGLLSVAAFVAVISFVVVIHELGHMWAGRMFGVHAEVFSVGFGPTLATWRDRQGTLWRIAALPLGGYVRFRGDENAASAPDHQALEQLRAGRADADSVFHFKPVWQRAIIVAAGPLANFLLAIVVFAALGMARGEFITPPVIGQVQAGSPAEIAGFEPGDRVVAINGRTARSFTDISQAVIVRTGQDIRFDVERGDEIVRLNATPRREIRADGLGGERAMGFLGVSSQTGRPEQVRYSLLEAPGYGVRRTWETVSMIGDYMVRLVTGRASFEMINGPIGIATTAGQVANVSVAAPAQDSPPAHERVWRMVLSLAALSAVISVALGLMNLLPIPVLDGGHLVYYAYEAVTRRAPSLAVQEIGFRIGVGLVLTLLVVATWNDLNYLRGLFF